jgi:hypothetical protein
MVGAFPGSGTSFVPNLRVGVRQAVSKAGILDAGSLGLLPV